MAVLFIGYEATPTYIALSSDKTSGSIIQGTPLIGKTVYMTDTQEWFIITSASATGYVIAPFQGA